MLHLKVGTKYTVQQIQMICGYNGKSCFSLSLTNMPPPPPYWITQASLLSKQLQTIYKRFKEDLADYQ